MGNLPKAPSEDLKVELHANADRNCARAAEAIAEADFFLLCTGAGFSADSGLAVYADVAKVPAYASRDLEYHDICQPHWLDTKPDLFWGFWGQCFNDYRDTAPHEGYEIVNKWVERYFRNSANAQSIRRVISGQEASGNHGDDSSEKPDAGEPYKVTTHPGAFFVFTSNVDAHHFDWFHACEIRECHGNTELYQCGRRKCSGVWRAPLDFKFNVDKSTMLASTELCPALGPLEHKADDPQLNSSGTVAPRIGCVKGGGRQNALRHMPGLAPGCAEAGFLSGHPKCIHCGGAARPAILMFGDGGWQDVLSQKKRWNQWSRAVCDSIKHKGKQGEEGTHGLVKKVVILEIGAGGNVTTVRGTSESQMEEFRMAGAEVKLVRVNLNLPLGDDEENRPGGTYGNDVISVMLPGLESIRRIDAALNAKMATVN